MNLHERLAREFLYASTHQNAGDGAAQLLSRPFMRAAQPPATARHSMRHQGTTRVTQLCSCSTYVVSADSALPRNNTAQTCPCCALASCEHSVCTGSPALPESALLTHSYTCSKYTAISLHAPLSFTQRRQPSRGTAPVRGALRGTYGCTHTRLTARASSSSGAALSVAVRLRSDTRVLSFAWPGAAAS
jgi:hypothetical protein